MIPPNSEILFMIRIYSIQDFNDWLLDGKDNGLSERVISKRRAWSFVNNPHAVLSTPSLAALIDNDEIKGYAAVFPEHFVDFEQKIYWGSTFFVDDSMRGQGCGVKILSALQDTLDGIYATTQTPESSTAIFKKLGAQETWFSEYWIKLRKTNPAKGKNDLLKQLFNRCYAFNKRKRTLHWCDSFDYRLEYCSFVDETIYSFIQAHRGNDLLLRSREMFNWILTYPFLQQVTLTNKTTTNENFFSCNKTDFKQFAVKVFDKGGQLVGFYIFKCCEGEANLLYLYYSPEAEDMVMASFYEHLIKLESVRLRTTSKPLVAFIKRHSLRVLAQKESRLNLCAPKMFPVPDSSSVQGGDGDMFVI